MRMGVPRRAGYGQAATMAMFVVKFLPPRVSVSRRCRFALGRLQVELRPLIRYGNARYQAGPGWVRLSPLNSPSIEYSDRKQLVQGG